VLACLALQPFTSQAVSAFAAKSLVRPLTVVSDGPWCFGAVKDAGLHQRVGTGGGTASVKLPQFRAINTVLSNLKTGLVGSYHAFDFDKCAHRYLGEFQYRFNRRFILSSMLPRLVRAARMTSPNPAQVIRMAEQCR
jgi:ISXO2-like transposase domain